MASYTYAFLSQVLDELSLRLYDATNTFWTDAEKTLYISEALRVFNSLTSYWRSEFTLNLTQGTIWYDLSSPAAVPNTNRPLTVTDTDLMTLIQYHLLEPPSGKSWTGSLQFSSESLIQSIERRRDELVSSTSAKVNRSLVPAIPGRTLLPDTVIDIRRIAWLPTGSPTGYVNTALHPSDSFDLQSYQRSYTQSPAGTPSTYLQSTQPPISFDVDVQPGVPGEYELLTVDAGPALSLASDTTLIVPDDFAWVIKFGALADLLNRDSNSRDSIRARYCNMRYQMGMVALLNAQSVLTARIANVPLDIDSAQNADDYRASWQAESQSTPDLMIIGGLNLIGFAATPDAGPHAATITTVRNAPVPLPADNPATTYVECGRDVLDIILDYAVHIALFKCGGQEFTATMPLLERFFKGCMVYNSKLAALGEYMRPMYELGQSQSRSNPVLDNPQAVTAQSQQQGGSDDGA